MRAVKQVRVTLGVGLAAIVAVGALTLTHSPPRVLLVGTRASGKFGGIEGHRENCQAGEVLPADVSAIRLSLFAYFGSPVRVTAYSGSRVLIEGRRAADWTGTSVTVPVRPLSHMASNVKLCVDIGPTSEAVFLLGIPKPTQEAAAPAGVEQLGGRLGVEYLAAGEGSWWSRILPVARHMGLGHALSGTWVALLIAALVAAVGALAIRLALRELPNE